MRLLESFRDLADGGQRLAQFYRYVGKSFGLWGKLARIGDTRRDPQHSTFAVMNALLHAAVLRTPSLLELESMLKDARFQRVLGFRSRRNQSPISDSTLARSLDALSIDSLNELLVSIFKRSERMKAFREDLYGNVRTVAVDGWEPYCSYKRHCEACLTREVKCVIEHEDGTTTEEVRTQYFHRYVVAFLIAPQLNMVLWIEPVLSADLKAEHVSPMLDELTSEQKRKRRGHEGELTAAKRVFDRLKQHYGSTLDVFALDALYACGPIFRKLDEHRYSAVVIAKRKNADPLRFAESVWSTRDRPDGSWTDDEKKEDIEYHELKDVDALSSYDGTVDMFKAVVTRNAGVRKGKTSTWAVAKVGAKAKKLGPKATLKISRARWQIENTAFHQWAHQWRLDHCFHHTPQASLALLLIWSIGFNLMLMFYFRRLKMGRKNAPTSQRVFWKCLMFDIAEYPEPIPWKWLFEDDTS